MIIYKFGCSLLLNESVCEYSPDTGLYFSVFDIIHVNAGIGCADGREGNVGQVLLCVLMVPFCMQQLQLTPFAQRCDPFYPTHFYAIAVSVSILFLTYVEIS